MKVILSLLVILTWANLARAQVPTCTAALAANPQGPFPCSITLAWDDNSNNETAFIIERQLNGGPWSQFQAVAANIITMIDGTLTQDVNR